MFHPLTSRLIMIAGLFAVLALAGCGGGSSGVENTLRQERDMLQDEVEDLETKLEDAQDDLKEAEEAKTDAEGQVSDAAEDLAEAESDAADAIAAAQRARDEARRQTQTLEANQRALNLLADFGDTGTPMRDHGVGITVPKSNQLVFKKETYTVGSLSAPAGMRAAKLTRTRGGMDTIVVYTDRELSRPLLEHYAQFKQETEAVQFQIDDTNVPIEIQVDTDENFLENAELSVDHGFDDEIAADAMDNDRTPTEEAAFFSGSVHGVRGEFRCGDASDCMITLQSAYAADGDDPSENELTSVKMVAGAANIFFRPSSPSAPIYLGASGVQGVTANDEEYMTFGWWRTEPPTALGSYQFGVFVTGADLLTENNIPADPPGSAEYDGTAVGMYVEQGGLGGTGVTTRQGEFVADARLDVDFDENEIEGTIDGFTTTPTGGSAAPTTSGSWAVKLMRDTTTSSVKVDIRGTTSTGSWSHQFVDNHENVLQVGPDDNVQPAPPAVVGSFNARIENLLHLVGAFGAHKR